MRSNFPRQQCFGCTIWVTACILCRQLQRPTVLGLMEQQLPRIQMALPRPSRFVTSHPALLQRPATVMLRITDHAELQAQHTFQLLLTTFCTFLGKLSRGALCTYTFGHLTFACLLMCCSMFSHMPVQLLNKPYQFIQWPIMRQHADNTPACIMAGYWQDVSRKSLGHAEKGNHRHTITSFASWTAWLSATSCLTSPCIIAF